MGNKSGTGGTSSIGKVTSSGKLGRKFKETIFFQPHHAASPASCRAERRQRGISSEIPTSDHLIWLPFSVHTGLPDRSEAKGNNQGCWRKGLFPCCLQTSSHTLKKAPHRILFSITSQVALIPFFIATSLKPSSFEKTDHIRLGRLQLIRGPEREHLGRSLAEKSSRPGDCLRQVVTAKPCISSWSTTTVPRLPIPPPMFTPSSASSKRVAIPSPSVSRTRRDHGSGRPT